MRNLTIIYRFSDGIYRSGWRNTGNADGAPGFSNGGCLLRQRRRRLKGIYRQSTEFLANLPISRLPSARKSSGNRKAAGRNRQITGSIATIIGIRAPIIVVTMTTIVRVTMMTPMMMMMAAREAV